MTKRRCSSCRIRSKSVALKRALFDEELLDYYRAEIGAVREELREAEFGGRDLLEDAAADVRGSSLSEVGDEG